MKEDILQTIIAHKRVELAAQEEAIPMAHLVQQLDTPSDGISMKASLASSPYGIIAEFKRKSPSKGWINAEADAGTIPASYETNGASALSILTDETFFGGTLKDIRTARPQVNLPILRKDFIISEYQLYQAKLIGADAILLIAACLTPLQCTSLARTAHDLKLEVLLEIHTEDELTYMNDHIDMVGVNNRNLGTFHTDVENSFRLAEKLPDNYLLVSESGISRPETVISLRTAGFRGFLMGETFMKTDQPGETLSHFINELKVCL